MNESGYLIIPDPVHASVRVDPAKCALCGVCARNCPTGALRTEASEGVFRLIFEPRLCNGCPGLPGCEAVCTERALGRTVDETDTLGRVLNESPMLRCGNCEEHFAPLRRVEAVERRRPGVRSVVRDYCPLCRGSQLVVRFINEKRLPGAEAQYRSARDILRRAGRLAQRK